jgi:hypothetical protein
VVDRCADRLTDRVPVNSVGLHREEETSAGLTVGAPSGRDSSPTLIQIKAARPEECASFAMRTGKPSTDDVAKEASDLMSLAAWYRCWAEVTESDVEKGRRLEFAMSLEEQARMLLRHGKSARHWAPH